MTTPPWPQAKKSTALRVEQGDVAGLLEAATRFLDSEGVTALADALSEDGNQPSSATRSFLDRVKSGAVILGSGVTTNAAYNGLIALIQQAFPGALS